MRPLAILTLGCVPLAVLTVWSLVELGSIDGAGGLPVLVGDMEAHRELAEGALRRADVEKPVVDELAEVELLAGETIGGLEKVPADSRLKAVAEAWPTWTAARRMVARFLQADRLAGSTDVDALKEAQRALEDLRDECQAQSVRGNAELAALVRRRLAAVKRQIARRELETEAGALVARARASFVPERYGECVVLCDELLSEHLQVIDASVAENLRILRRRACFWGDAEELSSRLEEAGTPAAGAALLEGFLNKYPSRDYNTPAEQQFLEHCRGELAELKDQLEAQQRSRAAAELIQQLSDELPGRFEARLQRTVAILDRYPTEEEVRARCRANVRQWLEEFLPEKDAGEHPVLKELETRAGAIIRGFFKEVATADGAVVGYKRYPTYEQFLKPVADVGTYLKEELKSEPGQSTPRRCVTLYNQARNQVLEEPQRREAWVRLAELCDTLALELRQYRQKPGSSDNQGLSFEEEGRFARQVLAGPAFGYMEKILGP